MLAVGPFSVHSTLALLRTLGLRCSLDREGLLASALTVARFAPTQPQQATCTAKRLLQYLDVHSERLLLAGSGVVYVHTI
jgi:hypothetical protein